MTRGWDSSGYDDDREGGRHGAGDGGYGGYAGGPIHPTSGRGPRHGGRHAGGPVPGGPVPGRPVPGGPVPGGPVPGGPVSGGPVPGRPGGPGPGPGLGRPPRHGRYEPEDDTVVIPAVGDRHDSGSTPRPSPQPRSHRRRKASAVDRVRLVLRGTGELLITLGLVVLLFVAYEVYVTDLISAGKQRDATAALDNLWSELPTEPEVNQRTEKFRPGIGEGFAKLYIPAFGSDFVFTVLEGTTDPILAIGPGHYTDTAYPGEPGNFSVAGHRVGKGAPFNDLGLLRSCDALVVETQQSWVVYRVLPMSDEVAGWEQNRGASARCTDVNPLGGPYGEVTGRYIVRPSQSEVIMPVPGRRDLTLDSVPPEQQAALITLTTCHPQFSNKERMIVHGVFVKQYPKDPANPDARPPELTES